MKSSIVKVLVLSGLLSPVAFSLSLYDMAPPVGLPESYDVRYNAHIGMGYDDNLNSTHRNPDGGAFVNFGVGASYSDQESADRISYSVNLGGRLYDDRANDSDQEFFTESSLKFALTHAFGAGSSFSTNLSLSYRPEPDYSNGISAARAQGECFNWYMNNAYTRAIDTRWSWTANLAYSGNLYTDSAYYVDDRQYLSGGLSFAYRASTLTTYNITTSASYDFRDYGNDSQNIYVTGGVNHALSPIASVYASAGVQVKFVDGETNLYPTIRVGYRRKLTEGLSTVAYVSLKNENVNTHRFGADYLSDLAWRVGAQLNYQLSHRVSFSGGAALLSSNYTKGRGALNDATETTWTCNIGMNYRITEQLTSHLSYNFTDANESAGDYTRNVVSAGVSYEF